VRADFFLVHIEPFQPDDLAEHQRAFEPGLGTGFQFLPQVLHGLALEPQILLQREACLLLYRSLHLLDHLVQCLFEHHRRILDLSLLEDVLQHMLCVLLVSFSLHRLL
jgi:hypothetical protein